MNETYVTIAGNVVGAPQVRMTRAEVPFVTFRVASNVRRVDYKTGEYIDAGTNFVNVTAFRSLGINLANSLEKGQPVIVYGRMRINQWTNGDRSGTTVEIDAYNVGHDLTKGQSRFEKVAKPQLNQSDRLADPAVQEASEALDLVDGAQGGRSDEVGESDHEQPAAGELGGLGLVPPLPLPGDVPDEESADSDDYVMAGAGQH